VTVPSDAKRGKNICFVATIEYSIVVYLVNHIKAMSKLYDITVITNTLDPVKLSELLGSVKVIHIPFERKIFIKKDFTALCGLIRHFRNEKYDAVHSLMPKTGLLVMLAGVICGIPIRIHTFTGQVWATKTGVRRWFLLNMDRVIAILATNIMTDSHSQKLFIVKNKVVSDNKVSVLSHGSICGVDTRKFMRDIASRSLLRRKYFIGKSDIVVLYLGRMTIDKGLLDLAQAYNRIRRDNANVHLMLVGPDEQDLKSKITHICSAYADKIHFVDYTNEPEKYMNCGDILCLPSYREGFGSVIIEAACVGIPSIATRIYGITDAIEDNVTGYLYEVKNIDDLISNILRLVNNSEKRIKMGIAARERVLRLFTKEIVTKEMVSYYNKLLYQQ